MPAVGFLCALMFFSCARYDAPLMSLAAFETRLSRTIVTRDARTFFSFFIPAKAVKDVAALRAMPFRFAFDPRDVKASIADKGVFFRRIFSDDASSMASELPASGAYPVRYDIHRKAARVVACIRYGGERSHAHALEYVALWQGGEWRLLTINIDDASAGQR